MAREKKSLEEKLLDKCGPEIVDGINEASPDELKSKLVRLAAYERETEEARDKDENLNDLKEQKKEAEAPYKDTLGGINLQRKYIAQLMEQQGKA